MTLFFYQPEMHHAQLFEIFQRSAHETCNLTSRKERRGGGRRGEGKEEREERERQLTRQVWSLVFCDMDLVKTKHRNLHSSVLGLGLGSFL
jgi:hypothetical protein